MTMQTTSATTSTSDDALIAALGRLGRTRAPATLLPRVLGAVGVAPHFATVETVLGVLHVAWTEQGVRAAMRNVDVAHFQQWYADRYGVMPQPAPLPARLAEGVRRVLHGEGRGALRFDLRGLRPFEQDVLQTALRIPRGEVRPYSWIARRIGRPLAVRAVGTALANNPIPYLIPCHRVVRADGTLGEYGGGGTDAKRAILDWEGVDATELERLARRGIRFLGSDTTRVFCYPTCRHARRITDAHRVPFASAESARTAGYRPCRDCTPVAMVAA
jgi:O-6-methylguanine DNA methyltransferase